MNPPRVYICSPSWTLLPPPSPYHPSGSSQCTSPKHPVSQASSIVHRTWTKNRNTLWGNTIRVYFDHYPHYNIPTNFLLTFYLILKTTFHLQLLQNIGYITHVVQYILELILYPIICPSLLSLLVNTSLFSVSVSLLLFLLYSLVH